MFEQRSFDENQAPERKVTVSLLHTPFQLPSSVVSSPDNLSLLKQTSIDSLHKSGKRRQQIQEEKKTTISQISQWLHEQWNNGSFFYVCVWFGWLFVGTVFYTHVDFHNSFYKGFYFSVNVGYSIGFGVLHEPSDGSKVFSIFYLLVGAIFVSRWLAYLIELHIHESESVHEQITIRQNLRKSTTFTIPWQRDLYVWIVMNYAKLFIIYLWLIYVFFGTAWTCAVINWSLVDGMYFAISAMSTGGLQGIPADSPDYAFFIVGLFACTGVPLMGMAVSNIATLILQARDFAAFDLLQQLSSPKHDEQLSDAEKEILKLMKGSYRKNVTIDRNEYLIIQLIRTRNLNVANVTAYYQEFDGLDSHGDGVITVSKLKNKEKKKAPDDEVHNILHHPDSNMIVGIEQKSYRRIDLEEAEGSYRL